MVSSKLTLRSQRTRDSHCKHSIESTMISQMVLRKVNANEIRSLSQIATVLGRTGTGVAPGAKWVNN